LPQLLDNNSSFIHLKNAEHLDSGRNFISDIYDDVKGLDGGWSETIPDGDYVRVVFERNLTSVNDITIYPRVVSGMPKIEVYEGDGVELIASFEEIVENEYNKVYLKNLVGEQGVFDLRIVGGDIEFDHIIDPSANKPAVSNVVLNSTRGTNYTTENLTVTFNVSDADGDAIYNVTDWRLWNGTGFESIAVLNMPFDVNYSNHTIYKTIRDYSTWGNNGSLVNFTQSLTANWTQINWTAQGIKGGAYSFDGADDYIDAGSSKSLDLRGDFSILFWINLTSDPAADRYILAKQVTSATGAGYHVRFVAATNKIRMFVGDGTDNKALSTSSTLSVGPWAQVAFTFNNSNDDIRAYFNGSFEVNATGSNIDVGNIAANLSIGVDGLTFSGTYLPGILDEILIVNRTLTPEQISSIYNDTLQTKYWKTLVRQETKKNQNWQTCVVPNDLTQDGTGVCSNNLTVIESFSINFVNPTPKSGDILITSNDLLVNVTTNALDFVNMTLYLYNSSRGLINYSNSSSSPFFTNFTNLSKGVYYFNATIYNSTGNNFTYTQNVLVLPRNIISDASVNSSVEINHTTLDGLTLLANDEYGSSVANIGDLDGDGIQDIVVGAEGKDEGGTNRGALFINFMYKNGTLKSYVKINSSTTNGPNLANSDNYGGAVANLGDLDGDGIQDIAVGAALDDGNGESNRGAVHIHFLNVSGSVNRTVEINDTTPNGPVLENTDRYGSSVVNLGDLDLDGAQDIAVGAIGNNNTGAVHISFLYTNGSIKSTVEINATTPNGPSLLDGDIYGRSITNLGDLDGDGIQDIAVGDTGTDGSGTDRGAVYISFMYRNGSIKSTIEINETTSNGPVLANDDRYGRSITNIGDLDGDGIQDIIVGAMNDDGNGGSNRGTLHINLLNRNGSVKSTVEINDTISNGPLLTSGDQYGISITNLGDLNLDGIQDIAVGAVGNDNDSLIGSNDLGAVHINFLSLDLTAPTITYVSPTQNDGVTINRNFIEVNVTASERGTLNNINISLYNSARSVINSSSSITSPLYINFSGLLYGTYYYNVTANDSANNQGNSSTRSIILGVGDSSTGSSDSGNDGSISHISQSIAVEEVNPLISGVYKISLNKNNLDNLIIFKIKNKNNFLALVIDPKYFLYDYNDNSLVFSKEGLQFILQPNETREINQKDIFDISSYEVRNIKSGNYKLVASFKDVLAKKYLNHTINIEIEEYSEFEFEDGSGGINFRLEELTDNLFNKISSLLNSNKMILIAAGISFILLGIIISLINHFTKFLEPENTNKSKIKSTRRRN